MNALIPVVERPINGEPIQTVNARDLHAFLEVGKDFSNWIKDRIAQYYFVENQDFIIFANFGENSGRGRPAKEYALTLDMAKELSMVERNARGKEARLYFIACERRAKAAAAAARVDVTAVLSDPVHLRTLLLSYTEKVLALEAKVQEQAPKAQFYDAVTRSVNDQSIQEVAKVLGTGPNRLFRFLRKEGLLMQGSNLPYQRYLDAGYFRVVEGNYRDSHGGERTYTRTLVTGKGFVYIQGRLQGQADGFMQAGPANATNSGVSDMVLV